MRLLVQGAQALGLTLTAKHLAAFETYYAELCTWNRRHNLTAVTGYEEVQLRHFYDSLTCLLALPQRGAGPVPDVVPVQVGGEGLCVVDVGSGAGFPGLPLKIMLSDMRLTLIEATGKKVRFLRHVVERLGLEGVEVLHARAEDVGQDAEHRERYDLVTARAVAAMSVLAEYCLPLCRPGGRVVAQKGEDAQAEADAARAAIDRLGGRLHEVKALRCAGLPEGRYLVVVDKVARTPAQYPRRAGMPAKYPLS